MDSAREPKDWVRSVPQSELNELHTSLRLNLQHPYTSGDAAMRIEHLAARLWAETCRRAQEGQPT